MTYIVSRPKGSWEARESFRTPDGPRSRTLASFREFTPEVADLIVSRSASPVDEDELVAKAERAGVPVFMSEVDRAAATLLRHLADGRTPRPGLAGLLAYEFGNDTEGLGKMRAETGSDRMRTWSAASQNERARTLVDLLDLGDALPARRLGESKFPRIRSG